MKVYLYIDKLKINIKRQQLALAPMSPSEVLKSSKIVAKQKDYRSTPPADKQIN